MAANGNLAISIVLTLIQNVPSVEDFNEYHVSIANDYEALKKSFKTVH